MPGSARESSSWAADKASGSRADRPPESWAADLGYGSRTDRGTASRASGQGSGPRMIGREPDGALAGRFAQMNEAQRRAAMHGKGPMLVLAGPGSGKTFVITNRISYLIQVCGVMPEHILVITFTKEAAGSMQRRFLEAQGGIQPVNFGTFHAVFYQMLKRSSPRGLPGILTDSDKKSLLLPILFDLYQENGQKKKREELNEELSPCLSAISFYKNTFREEGADSFLPEDLKGRFPVLFQEYEKARKRRGGLDFDDMLYGCLGLLSSKPDILRRWQEQFQYILIDEFQDINPMQYQVIQLLAQPGRNLFVVGDDDQSIYGFRGSEPALMQQFLKDYPECCRVTLRVNYRSLPLIVSSSLRMISGNRDRFSKDLEAGRKDAGEGSFVLKGFSDREAQYQSLMDELKAENHPEECAVLFRTNFQMQGFAARLAKAGIPYVMKEKSACIYDHFVCRDVRCYLRFALGEHSRELFLQIMNKPSRWISREAVGEGEVSFEAIRAYYRKYGEESWQKKIFQELRKLENGLEQIRNRSPFLGMQFLRKGLGYERYLKRRAGRDAFRLAEWMEILEFLTVEAAEFETYGDWMEAQEAAREEMQKSAGSGTASYGEAAGIHGGVRDGRKAGHAGENWNLGGRKAGSGGGVENPGGRKAGPGGEAGHSGGAVSSREAAGNLGVRLMTAHASKGLEFEKVFIPDVNEGTYPHGRMLEEAALEEERRILYVAMTRAKEALELTFVAGTKERPGLPSRFLNCFKLP